MSTETPEAILLAAGLGSRMRPLTDTIPKPMLPVAGRPLMDHVFIACRSEGVSRFVVNVHHLADQVLNHLVLMAKVMPDVRFQISDERDELMGTGGGVTKALPLIKSDPFLICNTDSFWHPFQDRPVPRMRQRLADTGADMVLLVVRPEHAVGFDGEPDFWIDGEGKLSLNPKGGRGVIYAGVALSRRVAFSSAPPDPFSLYYLFEQAARARKLAGTLLDADWFHIGSPIALQRAGELFQRSGPGGFGK